MRIYNRHNQNLLTNAMLGVDSTQLAAIKLMMKSLKDIYRFAGVPNMTKKNSVKEHTGELLKLTDFVAESLEDDKDKQNFRLHALLHDFGEVAGELTVVHDDLSPDKKIMSVKEKEYIEEEIFTIFMNLALAAVKDDNTNMYEDRLEHMRLAVEANSAKEAIEHLKGKIPRQDEFHSLIQAYRGSKMNKMLPIFLKGLDRAEGTYFFCRFAEDIDLTDKKFMQKAIEYNMASLYKRLPKNLGVREDYISTFKKVKTIVKAAVRRYKHLCRFDKLSWLDTTLSSINDWIGRYITWGQDNYVYYVKYWNPVDLFKVLTGEFKVYKSLEEIYNA